MRAPSVAAIAAVAISLACRGPTPPPPAGSPPDEEAFRAALAEGDAAFARRADPGALADALLAYRRAEALRAGGAEAALRVARAEGFRALSATAPAEARNAWMASARAAERALRALSPAWAAAIDAGAPAADAAARVEAPGAEALYRVSLGTLRAAQLTGYAALLAAKDSALPGLERAAVLDERVDAAGPHRALGALRAALPAAAGGGGPAARAHFDRARALFPDEQLARVAEAETYAVLVQDSGLFDRLLAEVLAFDPAAWPERAPENRVAQARARELRERRARLF
jgi:hypothetical protein